MKESTIFDILLPRYKVIADFPLSACKVGQILTLNEVGDFISILQINFWKTDISQYPHLFKQLKWWENRKFSELPIYIRWSATPDNISFFKVENWYTNPNTGDVAGVIVREGRLFIEDCQPATEKEYIIFNDKQTKNT